MFTMNQSQVWSSQPKGQSSEVTYHIFKDVEMDYIRRKVLYMALPGVNVWMNIPVENVYTYYVRSITIFTK